MDPININSKNNNSKKPVETLSNQNNSFNVRYVWMILLGIIALTVIAYSPISKNGFLNWDDDVYVSENNDIKSMSMENTKLLVTQDYVNVYLPLTMLSYAVDYKIGGLNPKVYTYTNLIFHILNSILVYYLVLLLIISIGNKINIPGLDLKKQNFIAAITSVIFAIHPINVESVAWISERKNLIFTFFFLLSVISYINYLKQDKYLFYFLSLLLFLCSLLSKGVAVSLSLCIVSLDYLFQRKLFSVRVVLEKIPYFLLSVIFGIIVINSQGKENVGNSNTLFDQIVFASYGFIGYLCKLTVPVNLSAYYSYPQGIHFIHWLYFILTITMIITLFIYRKRLSRLTVFAIIFFLANIIFLLQLIPVGKAIMADRYVYLSSIGFFLIAGIIIIKIASRFRTIYVLLAISLVFYGFTTHERVKIWNNSLLFWSTVIENDTTIPTAWLNRGFARGKLKDYHGALEDFNKSINLRPNYPEAFYNRGIIKIELRDINGGLNDFSTAIKIMPDYANAYCFRGNVRREMGDNIGALDDFNKAIRIKPKFKEAYNNRGIVFSNLGKTNEALSDFTKAIELDPYYADSYYNRAKFLKINKDYQRALIDLNQAIHLNPNFFYAYTLRAKVKLKLEDSEGAISDCNIALHIDNTIINIYSTRSVALYKSGKYNEAIKSINVVLQNNSQTGILYYIQGMSEIKLNNKEAGNRDLLTAKKLGFVASENELTLDLK